jgi:hypothetical protein
MAEPRQRGVEPVPSGDLDGALGPTQGKRLGGGRKGDKQHGNQGDGDEGTGNTVHDISPLRYTANTANIERLTLGTLPRLPPTINFNFLEPVLCLSVPLNPKRDSGVKERDVKP